GRAWLGERRPAAQGSASARRLSAFGARPGPASRGGGHQRNVGQGDRGGKGRGLRERGAPPPRPGGGSGHHRPAHSRRAARRGILSSAVDGGALARALWTGGDQSAAPME